MADDEKNLWGDLPDVPKRTPATILKEQAELIQVLTKGVLQGQVSVEASGERFVLTLRLHARALAYTTTVLTATHPMELYPLQVWGRGLAQPTSCKTETDFMDALRTSLRSDEVRRMLAALIAQSRATS